MSDFLFSKKNHIHADTLLAASLFLFVIILIAFVFSYYDVSFSQTERTVCPTYQRLCPDGTTASPVAPLCEIPSCEGHMIPDHPGITEEPQQVPIKTPTGKTDTDVDNIMCTQEVRMCADGSSVGRTGPKCEFAPCPGKTTDDTRFFGNDI